MVPGFNIYTNNFKRRIAADISLHLNMKKMAQAAKQNEQIYQSLTEPLLDGLLDISSTFPSTNDILTICSMTIAELSLLICIYLFFKQRKLSAMILVLTKAQTANSLNEEFIFVRQTSAPSKTIGDTIKDTLKWDHFLVVVAVLIFLMTLATLIKSVRSNIRGTTVLLELTNGTNCATVPLMTLPLCPSLLTITPPSTISNIILTPLLKFQLYADWTNFKITNKLTGETIDISNKIKISIMDRYRIHHVIQKPYMAYVMLQHCGLVMHIPNSNIRKQFE